MTINELYNFVRSGDRKSEKILFEKLHERFQLILRHRITNIHDIEDVAQESLLTISRKYKETEIKTSFSAWAHKILENAIVDYYRAKSRKRKRFAEMADGSEYSGTFEPDPEVKIRLLDCLRKVNSVNVRHARILNYSYQGFEIDNICARMKLTRNAAYILLSRARSMLKECLEKSKG